MGVVYVLCVLFTCLLFALVILCTVCTGYMFTVCTVYMCYCLHWLYCVQRVLFALVILCTVCTGCNSFMLLHSLYVFPHYPLCIILVLVPVFLHWVMLRCYEYMNFGIAHVSFIVPNFFATKSF